MKLVGRDFSACIWSHPKYLNAPGWSLWREALLAQGV
jgi:hypothetical protein